MAAIVHRCTCGHPDTFHSSISSECTTAACPCPGLDPGPPEVIPTWRSDGTPTGPTVPDAEVIPPGTVDGNGVGRLCACDACQALYRATVSAHAA